MQSINVIALCGSLRQQSTNMGMLRYAQANTPKGMNIHIADLSTIPFYNADLTTQPEAITKLFAQMEKADAFLFACTEYNYSIAPVLKNALDWASRATDNHLLAGKTAAILGAGGGMGTSRAQYHLRQVAVYLNLHVLNRPEVFCNAFAGTFDTDGNLIDPVTQNNIQQLLSALQTTLSTS